jgi:Tfp pilus assembly protein PilN
MSNASFLPEDYLSQKAEQRTNLISLVLFGVVMIAVIGAFFVTNRQARMVKTAQEEINTRYQKAGIQIQELTQLEKQKDEMLHKAELAAALVERVPRSILMAELINRMPERLALLEFEMKSEKIKPPAPPQSKDGKGRLVTKAKDKAKTKQEAGDTVQKVETPRYKVNITMVGVAPTDLEVSRYMAELNAYQLLRDVTLEYSEQKDIQGRQMRQFKINLSLDPDADVRRVDPLEVPRVRNPMKDDVQVNPALLLEGGEATPAPTTPQGQEGQ